MRKIETYIDDEGRRLEVYDAGTNPPSVVIRADAPGERAVSAPLTQAQWEDADAKVRAVFAASRPA